MHHHTNRLLIVLLSLFGLYGCIETNDPQLSTCEFSYDSDLYIPTQDEVQLIAPTLRDTVSGGKFTAEPQGLDLDSKTGVININTSESGIKYYITYTGPEGENVCQTSITISGIDYPSGTYNITDESQYVVQPFLDADREQVAPPGIYDQPRQFGFDFPPASEFGLEIDPETGGINLLATIENLRSSGANVENGFQRKFNIAYALRGDEQLVSSIEVVVLYYDTQEDIPQEILDLVAEKNRYPLSNRELGKRPPLLIAHGE